MGEDEKIHGIENKILKAEFREQVIREARNQFLIDRICFYTVLFFWALILLCYLEVFSP